MKKLFYAIIAVAVLAGGCNGKKSKEEMRLIQLTDSLRNEATAKDTSINGMLASFNEIESNLNVIKEKQALISLSTKKGELTPDVRTRIKNDIQLINDLLAKNKATIASLNKKLKNSNMKVDELQKMVDQLTASIAEKDKEIASLKEQLEKLNFSVTSLNASIDTLKTERKQLQSTVEDRDRTVEARTNELNTAYYVIGTKKDLIAKNIIAKEGGFIGINSTVKVKQEVSESNFTKVDIRNFGEVPVSGKKVKLVTTHPAGSYRMVTDAKGAVEKIEITNPSKFWSVSKYLVVMY